MRYHQTILLEFSAHYIDEARGIAVHPKTALLKLFERHPRSEYSNSYYYYLEDSAEIDLMGLLKFLMIHEDGASHKHLSNIPIFENLKQKGDIENLINNNTKKYQSDVAECKEKCYVGYNSGLSDSDIKFAKIDMATTLMVKKTLEEYKIMNL